MRSRHLALICRLSVLSALTCSLLAAPMHSQTTTSTEEWSRVHLSHRVPVKLILTPTEELSRGSARIVRDPFVGSDVVYMSEQSATPVFVAEAMYVMLLLRESAGDTATEAQDIVIRRGGVPARLLAGDASAAARFLVRPESFHSEQLSRLGMTVRTGNLQVRAGYVYLPSRALRLRMAREGRMILRKNSPSAP